MHPDQLVMRSENENFGLELLIIRTRLWVSDDNVKKCKCRRTLLEDNLTSAERGRGEVSELR